MEEPKQNPMKKIAWLIVIVAVLAAVAVKLPPGSIPALDDPKKGTTTGATTVTNQSKTSDSSSTLSKPAPVDEAIHVVPDPLPDTVGAPDDIAEDLGTLRNDTSVASMDAAALMMNAEHERLLRKSEPGVLLLDGSGLHFTPTNNPEKDVYVPLSDVVGVDHSGIKVRKGHDEHFKIQNTDNEQGERIFRDWLRQAMSSNR